MSYCGKTDVGKVRKENQDAFSILEFEKGGTLYTVCDGMGGANGGQIASTVVIGTFVEHFSEAYNKNPEMSCEEIEELFQKSILVANNKVIKMAKDDNALEGMGTTIVTALVRDNVIIAANVGDSRLYLIEKDSITKISHDHSYVQFLVDIGQLTEEEAKNSPKKNIITRAVGVEKGIEADMFVVELGEKEDDATRAILLCSDGLSNCVKEDSIVKYLNREPDCEKRVDKLIDSAMKNGGNDNITVIVADC